MQSNIEEEEEGAYYLVCEGVAQMTSLCAKRLTHDRENIQFQFNVQCKRCEPNKNKSLNKRQTNRNVYEIGLRLPIIVFGYSSDDYSLE